MMRRNLSGREDGYLNQHQSTSTSSYSTAALVTRAQQGEAEAFEELFQQHKQRVYALCLRMIGNTAEAEELTQEAFMQAFRKMHTFRGESAFSTWLHRLSVNVVLMRMRKKTVAEMPLDEWVQEEDAGEHCKQIGAADPVLTGSIDRVHLQRAMAQLAPGYKQVFVLHDVQGYEHREIAVILGCSIGNSKSQLHKARMRMRELLQEAARDSWRQKRVSSRARLARPMADLCSSLV